MPQGIFFQEISGDPSEFLHELSDPALVRAHDPPEDVSSELRRQQVVRLERNIETLRQKQAEFNAKMEEYVANLGRLIQSLEESLPQPSAPAASDCGGIHVRCQQCAAEKLFTDWRILFARESADSFHQPTECYVSDDSSIKKGVFYCSSCGGDSLTIRAC